MYQASSELTKKAMAGFAALSFVMGLVLFLCAGTLRYPEGWLFLGVFLGASLGITLYLMKNDPRLLASRVRVGPIAENRLRQKLIQLLASGTFLAALAIPALDRRFSWSDVPLPFVMLGDFLIVAGFSIVLWVFKENSFAASTIEVGADQKLIDTGPYAWVRHPMYAGALPLLAGIPLALGSWWGLLTLMPFIAMLILRVLDEEALLRKELSGYDAYCQRTHYRLFPHVW